MNLPQHVLIQIGQELDFKSVFHLSLTCKQNNLVDSEDFWQAKCIDLGLKNSRRFTWKSYYKLYVPLKLMRMKIQQCGDDFNQGLNEIQLKLRELAESIDEIELSEE